MFKALGRLVWNALALFGGGALLYFGCFNVSRITSGSMAPTLVGTNWENGDMVLTEKVSYRLRRPRRWEVATILRPDKTMIMKRVVGLPGETIQIRTRGNIMINGRTLVPPPSLDFLNHLPFGNLAAGRQVACGDGYYVLGDDSLDSDDSRFNGPVSPRAVVGRAWIILAPAGRRGFVYASE